MSRPTAVTFFVLKGSRNCTLAAARLAFVILIKFGLLRLRGVYIAPDRDGDERTRSLTLSGNPVLVEVSVSLRNILEIDEHKQVSPSLSTFNKGVFYRSPQTLVSLSGYKQSPSERGKQCAENGSS